MARVLLIDDDETIALMYAKGLTAHGHAVSTASSVMQALATVAKDTFDYIFVDVKMPDFDGINFLKRAQLATAQPNAKVIALSNTESPSTVKKALALGVDSYLIKVDFSPYGLAQIMKQGKI